MLKIEQQKQGQRIKLVREHKGLTLMELAEMVGMTYTTLSRTENGHTKPRASTLREIAEKTGASFHWLQTGEGQMIQGQEKREPGQTSVDPWKDEAYTVLKEENRRLADQVAFFMDLLKGYRLGKLNKTGQMPLFMGKATQNRAASFGA